MPPPCSSRGHVTPSRCSTPRMASVGRAASTTSTGCRWRSSWPRRGPSRCPCTEIVDRLGDRFRLLRRTDPWRPGPPRWAGGGDRLELRAALRRRAGDVPAPRRVPGGATADAVERVCGADGLDLASRLVDRSLLVADTSGPAVRFSMLESLRAYGCSRLRIGRSTRRGPRPSSSPGASSSPSARQRGNVGRRATGRGSTASTPSTTTSAPPSAHAVEHDPEAALRLLGAVDPTVVVPRPPPGDQAVGGDGPRCGRSGPPLLRARVMSRSRADGGAAPPRRRLGRRGPGR